MYSLYDRKLASFIIINSKETSDMNIIKQKNLKYKLEYQNIHKKARAIGENKIL
jgi:hypothetical protein